MPIKAKTYLVAQQTMRRPSIELGHSQMNSTRALLLAFTLLTTTPALAQQAPAPVTTREAGLLVMQNIPEASAALRERLVQYNNTRAASFQDFTPDGGILIATRFGDTPQIHAVAMPMGARTQLTYYAEPVGGASVRPRSGGNFVFAKDKGGDEFFQAYLFDRSTGLARQLSEAGTRNEGLNFSKDGKMAAWSVTRSGSARRDIVVANPDDATSRRVVYSADGSWGVSDISADGKKLLLGEYVSITYSKRAVLDIATGTLTPVTPDLRVSYDGGAFSTDGKAIYTLSDESSEFAYLVKIDLASGARTRVSPLLNWDVEGFDLSPDGTKVAYLVNEDGLSKLYVQALGSAARPQLVRLPIGTVGGVDWDEASARLGFTLSTATTPGDAYTYTVATRALTRWTASEIGGLNAATFVEPILIRYPTFDQVAGQARTIPAFVYKPRGASATNKRPVIINIHGGPEGQSRPSFSSTPQYWVNELGAAVIYPNVRGSTGYGKSYVDLDNGMKREDSVKDIGALLDWIGTQPDLDPSRVVVYGGSYGGYMVLASMTNYNDRLAGGIDIVGISNFSTFLKNTQGYRRDLRRVEYGDERQPEMAAFHERIAPLNNAAKITKPLFVIQGANDPRVPISEADQIVARVRGNGGDVWYMVAKDEGHGFAKKTNRDAQREAETLFLQKLFGTR
jgi:dipeptidyl aminopeptidase/acylaminoacyl peptidase